MPEGASAQVKPYFETVTSFADVPITSRGVETRKFLEASDGLIQMFDLFSSIVFGFVQNDLKANMKGIKERYNAKPRESETLEDIVRHSACEASKGHNHVLFCVTMLFRGLHYTCRALQNAQRDTSSELRIAFKKAYDEVLKKYHPFVIRELASVAIRAVPTRRQFYTQIAQGGSMEKLNTELDRWLEGLERVVCHMGRWMADGGYGTI